MGNTILKYLLFLCILLMGASCRADEFKRNISPTLSPHKRNSIVLPLSGLTKTFALTLKTAISFYNLFFYLEEIAEDAETNKKTYPTQENNYTKKPSICLLGLQSKFTYYYLFKKNHKGHKRFILNCAYLL